MREPRCSWPAKSPLVSARSEEYLDLGIREDHCPDIAALHDTPPCKTEPSLHWDQGISDLGQRRHRRCHQRAIRGANLGADVLVINEYPRAFGIGDDIDAVPFEHFSHRLRLGLVKRDLDALA